MNQVLHKILYNKLNTTLLAGSNYGVLKRTLNKLGAICYSDSKGMDPCKECMPCRPCKPYKRKRRKPHPCPPKPCPKLRLACEDEPDHCPYKPPPCKQKCISKKKPRVPPPRVCC